MKVRAVAERLSSDAEPSAFRLPVARAARKPSVKITFGAVLGWIRRDTEERGEARPGRERVPVNLYRRMRL